MRDLRQAVALAGLLVLCALPGCTPRNPVIHYEGETQDGMVPVTGTGMKQAWVRPDINLSSYRKLLLEPAEFQFRPTEPLAGRTPADPSMREFPINQADREKLVATVTEVFREALSGSRYFTLTDQPGPEVLTVQISLLDIVSKVPPEGPGRTNVYVNEFGSADLVLELRDSQSGEILARAVDRGVAEPIGTFGRGSDLRIANPVTTAQEVRRAAQRWATLATQRIDQLYNRGRMPSQAAPPSP